MKWLLLLLIPTVGSSYMSPSQFGGWDKKSPQEKAAELKQSILMEEQRRDMFVAACLQSYAEPGRSYNDEWHAEMELKAIKCAYRILDNLSRLDDKTAKEAREESK